MQWVEHLRFDTYLQWHYYAFAVIALAVVLNKARQRTFARNWLIIAVVATAIGLFIPSAFRL